jgi:hypothetical protein
MCFWAKLAYSQQTSLKTELVAALSILLIAVLWQFLVEDAIQVIDILDEYRISDAWQKNLHTRPQPQRPRSPDLLPAVLQSTSTNMSRSLQFDSDDESVENIGKCFVAILYPFTTAMRFGMVFAMPKARPSTCWMCGFPTVRPNPLVPEGLRKFVFDRQNFTANGSAKPW